MKSGVIFASVFWHSRKNMYDSKNPDIWKNESTEKSAFNMNINQNCLVHVSMTRGLSQKKTRIYLA
jgi:hypothetical protein